MPETEEEQYQMPSANIWNHAAKIAITEDKPIMMDYWVESLDKNVFIGIKTDDEKLLVKSAEEYTSPISRIYKLDTVFLICTENSIYIVSSAIEKRRVG
tara:strand:- start:1702 stop:1998 length:297 start_codon:yes stop_codon:yes gene_type:complete